MAALLNASLPARHTSVRKYTIRFSGVDARDRLGVTRLLSSRGMYTRFDGALTSIPTPEYTGEKYATPVSMHAVGDGVLIFWHQGSELHATYRTPEDSYTAVVATGVDDFSPRTVVLFNDYASPASPLSSYTRYGLVYPDKKMFPVVIEDEEDFRFSNIPSTYGSVPVFTDAAVHLSRVFGVNGDRVFASAYNDFRDYRLDTASDISASHAWASTAQANVRADGDFTAITAYDDHVMCFKKDFTHIINNNKNPFRIASLASVGCASKQSIAEVDGKLYFAGADAIYQYAGGEIKRISDALGRIDCTDAVGASFRGQYYVYLPHHRQLYVYDAASACFGEVLHTGYNDLFTICATRDTLCLLDVSGKLWEMYEDGICEAFDVYSGPLVSGTCEVERIRAIGICVTLGEDAYLSVGRALPEGDYDELLSTDEVGMHVYRAKVRGLAGETQSLYLNGYGPCTIHAICLEVEEAEE